MEKIMSHLTSITSQSRSGPCRQFVALALCAMLVLGSTFPGVAFASEGDSEGEGTASPIEAPDPSDFDPGGEESTLEETPSAGGDVEGGVVEVEPEVDAEVPAPETSSANAAVEEPESQPVGVPAAPPASEPETVQQTAAPQDPSARPSEPVANRSLAAPKQKPSNPPVARDQTQTVPLVEPAQEEVPSSPAPQPAATMPVVSGRNLAGKRFYVVQPGDCLSYIAAALLPGGASAGDIEAEVKRLWQLNEDRIGTGDPNLILVGTKLQLH
jgi:hypothetical protein